MKSKNSKGFSEFTSNIESVIPNGPVSNNSKLHSTDEEALNSWLNGENYKTHVDKECESIFKGEEFGSKTPYNIFKSSPLSSPDNYANSKLSQRIMNDLINT